jgi:hypothetical protein
MRRVLAIVTVVLTMVAGVTIAEAKVAKGKFGGTTEAGDPVGFKIDKKGRVLSFYFEGVHLTCSDGDSFDSGTGSNRIQTPSDVRFKPVHKKFSIQFRNDAQGNGWDTTGTFRKKGKKASGTLSAFANFDEHNQPDPNGSVHCKSGTLDWSVKRK